jgi:hypothetical protein
MAGEGASEVLLELDLESRHDEFAFVGSVMFGDSLRVADEAGRDGR